MKRLLESRLLSAAVLTALGIALGLVPPFPKDDLPPLSEIQGPETSSILSGHTRGEVLAAWGEPDGMLSGFYGDIYILDEYSSIIIYYDSRPLNDGTANESTVPVLNTVYSEA